MSGIELVKDILTLNFSHAWERVRDYLLHTLHLPEYVVGYVDRALTTEAKILNSLIVIAKADVAKAGGNSDAYIAAAKDVFAQLQTLNIATFNLNYVFAELNNAIGFQPITPSQE